MEWPRDNAYMNETDLLKVFKYEEQATTVVKLMRSNGVGTPCSFHTLHPRAPHSC